MLYKINSSQQVEYLKKNYLKKQKELKDYGLFNEINNISKSRPMIIGLESNKLYSVFYKDKPIEKFLYSAKNLKRFQLEEIRDYKFNHIKKYEYTDKLYEKLSHFNLEKIMFCVKDHNINKIVYANFMGYYDLNNKNNYIHECIFDYDVYENLNVRKRKVNLILK